MKEIRLGLVLLTLHLIFSCEEVPEFGKDDIVPVVEGFIYAQQPVNDIYLTKVIPFSFPEDESIFLSGLQPEITYNGQQFILQEYADEPGKYFYPGSDLNISSGQTYQLQFNFEGKLVQSITQVPPFPREIQLSVEELSIPQIQQRRDIRNLIENESLQVLLEWDNSEGKPYYLTIENLEQNPESIDPEDVINFNFNFVSQPTQNDFFSFRPLVHFNQYGTHRIILYRVNEAYALLYETRQQDSRDLNEPFSNVTNGVGIFSAFASDTVYLEINK